MFPALRARAGQGYTRGYATRDNKNHRKVTPRFRARLGHDYGDVLRGNNGKVTDMSGQPWTAI